jgi:hypothetical protein
MPTIFQSELINCINPSQLELNNINIQVDSATKILFEIIKIVNNEEVSLIPQRISYCSETKELIAEFMEGQINIGDQFKLKVSSL